MWLKYIIYAHELPIGFKFNYKSKQAVLGGPEKIIETMFFVLIDYFDKRDLVPINSSTGRIKFKFGIDHQTALLAIRKMERDNILVNRTKSLERIYR